MHEEEQDSGDDEVYGRTLVPHRIKPVNLNDPLPPVPPAPFISMLPTEDKAEGLRLPESSTEKENSNEKVESLPSISLLPFHDLDHPERPSESLNFAPIYRILPTGNEILGIGRYSTKNEIPPDPKRIPSAAPISFESKSVSRRHCKVGFANGQWWIRDVGSSGGTFLNGERLPAKGIDLADSLRPRFPLHDNDLLELGSRRNRSGIAFEPVIIRVSFKGWSKNISSTEERRRVPQQDHKIPAAAEREGETELGDNPGMPQSPTLSVSRL
jgi:pSer/pThr/pTyr-binding forkhead associated (FHA) protein